jgi:hypothetical protein
MSDEPNTPLDLFGDTGVDAWQSEWDGMPEYDNRDLTKSEVVVTLHFASTEDYERFEALLREHLYAGRRPFDGRQRKDAKTAWWPPLPKGSDFVWVSDEP